MKSLDHLLEKNRQWADKIKQEDPNFFNQLSNQQKPEYLWIGCADSRVPATEIVDLPPGEIFVHRNIANLVVHTDLNCLSVLQFAVEVLRVKHIIVCGHYNCGGINAALDKQDHGLIDNWLRHIQDVHRFHQSKFTHLNPTEQADLLCELNVMEQVENIAHTTIVKNAWANGQNLTLHGWIYSVSNGIIKNLQVSKNHNGKPKQ